MNILCDCKMRQKKTTKKGNQNQVAFSMGTYRTGQRGLQNHHEESD